MSRSNRILFAFLTCGILAVCAALARADDWKPAKGPLVTRWAKDVSPTNAHPEYPRPQMVRSEWQSLNGLWQFAAAREGEQPPVGKDLKEQILVPFPVESSLSGVMRHEERMWYRRTFQVPSDWRSRHVLLHLDAVDWEAVVYLNGQKLGTHRGGYDAFGYDVTKHLKPDGPQELIVGVYDPTNQWDQPRGKQVTRPRGIFYTPTSGIWQTVWIEPVPEQFIESMQIVPEVDAGEVKITVTPLGAVRKLPVSATVSLKEEGSGASSSFSGSASGFTGRPLTINIPNASLWSPEHPVLYSLHLTLSPDNKPGDQIDGYFAMRKISVGKDDKGINRLMLNNKPIFMVGPLDQGFWPDGIYTAPTDDALKFDIEMEKKLGFNMVRKHVKVEPQRWYYWADKLGLLVWQDMPSGNNRTDEGKKNFEHELDRLIESHRNSPSIVMWVVFNEGWGQFDTQRLAEHVKKMDPTRLVNCASGWSQIGADGKPIPQRVMDKLTDLSKGIPIGDVSDMHHYSDPAMPMLEPTRAAVLGEFGGLGLPVDGHMWTQQHWGYRGVADQEQLTNQYVKMLDQVQKLRDKGLCAAVYTQITDVETESNGLMTYDREVTKVNVARAAAAARGNQSFGRSE